MLILSLCIPTYNRAALLVEALTAIAAQVNASNAQQLEIIISDNASPDDTAARVQRFVAEHPDLPLVYHRQPHNLGADANMYALVKLARAPFMLLLSDDDILLPGAIDYVLSSLAANPRLRGVCLNYRTFLRTPDEPSAPIFRLPADRIVHSPDALLGFLGTWITFMSNLVFSREIVGGRDYAARIGSSFLPTYVHLEAFSAGRDGCFCPDTEFLVSSKPYLAIRGNNTGGYNFFEIFISGFAAMLRHAESLGYAPATTRKVLIEHERFILDFIIAFKVRGAYGTLKPDYRDGVRRLLTVYRFDPLFLARAVPLMLIPQPVFGAVRAIRRALRGRRSA